jgi:hypothetical protein
LQNSWKKEEVVIPGNPGESRGRPGIQDFHAILDSGSLLKACKDRFRRNDMGNNFCKKFFFLNFNNTSGMESNSNSI